MDLFLYLDLHACMLIFHSIEFILEVRRRYRIVRVNGVDDNALNELDKVLGTEVASVAGLNDGGKKKGGWLVAFSGTSCVLQLTVQG